MPQEPTYLSSVPPLPDTLETKLWRAVGVSDDTIRQWLERRQVQRAELEDLASKDVLGGYNLQNPTGGGLVAAPPSTRLQQAAEGTDKLLELITALGGVGPANPKFGAEPMPTAGARGGRRAGAGRPTGSVRAPKVEASELESQARIGENDAALKVEYETRYADAYRNLFGTRSGDPKVEAQRHKEVDDSLRQPARQSFLARPGDPESKAEPRGGTLATRSQKPRGKPGSIERMLSDGLGAFHQKEGRMLRPEEQKFPIRGTSLDASIDQLYERGTHGKKYKMASEASALRSRIPADAKVIQATEVAQGKGRRSLFEIEQELVERRDKVARVGDRVGHRAPTDESSKDSANSEIASWRQALDEGLSVRNIGRGTRDTGKGNQGTRVLPPTFYGRPYDEAGQLTTGGEASFYGDPIVKPAIAGELLGIIFEPPKPPNQKRVEYERTGEQSKLDAVVARYEAEKDKTATQRNEENQARLKARELEGYTTHYRDEPGLVEPNATEPNATEPVVRSRPLSPDDVLNAMADQRDPNFQESDFARDLGGRALVEWPRYLDTRRTPEQVLESRIQLARKTGVLPTAPKTLDPGFRLLKRLAAEPVPETTGPPKRPAPRGDRNLLAEYRRSGTFTSAEEKAANESLRNIIAEDATLGPPKRPAPRGDRNLLAEYRRSGTFTSEEENAANESLRNIIAEDTPKGLVPLARRVAEIKKARKGVTDRPLLALADHLQKERPKAGPRQKAYDAREEVLRQAVESQFENRIQTPAQRALAEHSINPRPTDKESAREYDALTVDLTKIAKEEGRGLLTQAQKERIEASLSAEMGSRRVVAKLRSQPITGLTGGDASLPPGHWARKRRGYGPRPVDKEGKAGYIKPKPLAGGGTPTDPLVDRIMHGEVNPDAYSSGGHVLPTKVGLGLARPIPGQGPELQARLGISAVPDPLRQSWRPSSAISSSARITPYRTGTLAGVLSGTPNTSGALQRVVDQGAEALRNVRIGNPAASQVMETGGALFQWSKGPLGAFVMPYGFEEQAVGSIVKHGRASAVLSSRGRISRISSPSYLEAAPLFKALKALGVSEADLAEAARLLSKKGSKK
jgi:hypothetical protein